MRYSLVCLIATLIFTTLIIGLVVIHWQAIIIWKQPRQTIVLPSTTACSPNLDSLVPINLNQPVCCYHNGNSTGAYAVTLSTGQSFSVASEPTYFGTVCREFCSTGSEIINGQVVCTGVDTSGQAAADQCVKTLKPVGCVAASYPVAVIDAEVYYPLHAQTNYGLAECSPSTCGPTFKN